MLTPFCDETEWEENVKDKSKAEALAGQEEDEKCATPVAAKTLCIPFEQPPLPEGTPGSPTLTLTLALALTRVCAHGGDYAALLAVAEQAC